MRNAPFLAVALLASSCGASQAPQPDRALKPDQAPQPDNVTTPPVERIAPWDASGCGDDQYQNEKLERHPALIKQSDEVLIRAFGSPSAREDFVVGGPSGIFYGVWAKLPGGSRHPSHGRAARVVTWTKASCNFSVFFLKSGTTWTAVEAFEWAVGADF